MAVAYFSRVEFLPSHIGQPASNPIRYVGILGWDFRYYLSTAVFILATPSRLINVHSIAALISEHILPPLPVHKAPFLTNV